MSKDIKPQQEERALEREYFYPNAGIVVSASSKEEADKKVADLHNKASIKN